MPKNPDQLAKRYFLLVRSGAYTTNSFAESSTSRLRSSHGEYQEDSPGLFLPYVQLILVDFFTGGGLPRATGVHCSRHRSTKSWSTPRAWTSHGPQHTIHTPRSDSRAVPWPPVIFNLAFSNPCQCDRFEVTFYPSR